MRVENKINALASYLECDPEEITIDEWDSNVLKTPDGEYAVYTDEEADRAAVEYEEGIIDDLGLEAFTDSFLSYVLCYCVDDSYFEDICREDYSYYAEDIKYESDDEYGNRLNQECIEAGLISESDIDEDGDYIGDEDLVDLLAEHHVEITKQNYDSFADWYFSELGIDSMNAVIKENPDLLDIEAITDELISWDGRGHILSFYDGKEIELDDDLYAYRL